MKHSKTILSIVLAALVHFGAAAGNYSCFEFSPLAGFPSNVTSFCIQPFGFAWIGSDTGLYTLTGSSSFVKYTGEATLMQKISLPGSKVLKLYRDDRDVLWVLTDNGFAGYHISVDSDDVTRIPDLGDGVQAYSVISRGADVYFGGDNCLWHYNYETGEFVKMTEIDASGSFRVYDIFMGYGNGGNDMILFSKDTDHYFIVNLSDGSVRRNSSDVRYNIISGFTDSRGYLWLAEFNGGVYSYDSRGRELARYNTSNSGMSSDIVLCFEERAGKIWMGTEGGGINILDPKTGDVEVLLSDVSDPGSIPSSTITTMVCDHNDNMWCGCPNGGAFVVIEPLVETFAVDKIRPEISPEGISAVYQDPSDGQIWIGTAGSGLYRFDAGSGSFTQISSTAGMNISSITSLDSERLVVSCRHNIVYVYDKASGAVGSRPGVSVDKSSLSIGISGPSVSRDSAGRVVFASDGIRIWDNSSRSSESFKFPIMPEGSELTEVYNSSSRFFTDATRLYSWDPSNPSSLRLLCEFFDDGIINSAAYSPTGSVWLAVSDRLYQYDLINRELAPASHYFESDALSLVCDELGRVWVCTRNSILLYDDEMETTLSLERAEGIVPNEYCPQARLLAADGSVYFGGSTALVRIPANFHMLRGRDPEIEIMSVYVDDKAVQNIENLAVPPTHNTVLIRFFVRSNDIMQKKSYRILCDGPNGRTDLETEHPEVLFRHLKPGKYSVYISCTTRDGRWTEIKDAYTFVVTQYWYLQVWAMILFCIAIAAAVFAVARAANAKRLREEKARSEKAQMASEMKSLFVQNMSHDIRTPLNAIVGYSQLLGMPDGSFSEGEKEEFNEYIASSADMLTMLVDDVLCMSDIEHGIYAIDKCDTSCNEICEKSVRCSMMRLPVGVRMYCTSEVDDDYTIYTDPKRVQQILVNFLSNACKHTAEGEIRVHCSLSENPGKVTFSVTDTGEGVPKDLADNIFERYKTQSEEGHGLGLNICYNLSGLLGGEVGLDTGYSGGARFWLVLPLK